MQESYDLLFASSNKHKFKEAKTILNRFGISLGFLKCNLEEIQSDSVKKVASHKARQAYNLCLRPVIVEDDGLFIKSLNGFPGIYSSYVFKTIGNKGVLQLVGQNRTAQFQAVIAYCDKKYDATFNAVVKGRISKKSQGNGWGYDPIFIPDGKKHTYAVLSDKNILSHRYKALKKFSNWFAHKKQAIYQ